MGAWGYGPFDNDSSLDWISYFINCKTFTKLVKQKDPDPNELRAAAAIIIQLHKVYDLWFDQQDIDKLISHLEDVINDDEWFESWVSAKDAKGIKKEIHRYVRELKKLEGYS